jgi:peptide/nickel transport system substrate-binding protein
MFDLHSGGRIMLRLLTLAFIVAALAVGAAGAATLRWANRGDPQTTDPHSQNEGLTNNVNQLV